MKYQSAKLRQMLAAEYVLGTLRGPARARFERLARSDRAVAAELRYWEQRLAGLGLRLAPKPPRAVVWAAIEQRIHAGGAVRLPAAGGLPHKVNFWRVWAVAATVGCLALAWQLRQQLDVAPQMISVPTIVAVPQPVPYVAVLQPGGDVKFVLALSPEKGQIKVAVSGDKPPVDYKLRSLELWVLDDGGKPHSLGVMPESGEAQMPMPKGVPMPEKPTLAISDEPKGGSPTGQPTGPVLTAGPAIRAL